MIELEPEILKACQKQVLRLDHLARLVVKERWPKSDALAGSIKFEISNSGNGVDYSTRINQLKHAAVNGPQICIYEEYIESGVIKCTMSDVALWMWSYFFRDQLLGLIRNRMVVRDLSEVPIDRTVGLTRIISSSSKRVNIFGRTVNQFITHHSDSGIKMTLNPKYKLAADQVIFFHPDIAHFQFPNEEQWIGELHWINIPNLETNPDCKIGFYRLVTTAAAKPIFPEFGLVATVVPKGIRGFIYYWAWKLCRFVP